MLKNYVSFYRGHIGKLNTDAMQNVDDWIKNSLKCYTDDTWFSKVLNWFCKVDPEQEIENTKERLRRVEQFNNATTIALDSSEKSLAKVTID